MEIHQQPPSESTFGSERCCLHQNSLKFTFGFMKGWRRRPLLQFATELGSKMNCRLFHFAFTFGSTFAWLGLAYLKFRALPENAAFAFGWTWRGKRPLCSMPATRPKRQTILLLAMGKDQYPCHRDSTQPKTAFEISLKEMDRIRKDEDPHGRSKTAFETS